MGKNSIVDFWMYWNTQTQGRTNEQIRRHAILLWIEAKQQVAKKMEFVRMLGGDLDKVLESYDQLIRVLPLIEPRGNGIVWSASPEETEAVSCPEVTVSMPSVEIRATRDFRVEWWKRGQVIEFGGHSRPVRTRRVEAW